MTLLCVGSVSAERVGQWGGGWGLLIVAESALGFSFGVSSDRNEDMVC